MKRIWSILTRTREILKISTLVGSFWAKYITFQLKKYRGSIFHDTEKWYKILAETDLWFGKWHEEIGKVLQEHLKSQNWDIYWVLLPEVENVWA